MEVIQIVVTLLILIVLGILTFSLIKNGEESWSSIFVANNKHTNKVNGIQNQVTGEAGGTRRVCFDLKCPEMCCPPCGNSSDAPTKPDVSNKPDTPTKTDVPNKPDAPINKPKKKDKKKRQKERMNGNLNTCTAHCHACGNQMRPSPCYDYRDQFYGHPRPCCYQNMMH